MSYCKVTTDYINWIRENNNAIIGHFFTFLSNSGVYDYFTDLDIDITYGGNLYKSSSLRFSDMGRKLSVGLNVDQQTLKIWAKPTDTLFGDPFLSQAEGGLLDWALITKQRAVWQYVTGNAAYDVVNYAPLQVWTLFTGYMSDVVAGGASHVEFKIKSPLVKLDVDMPRNFYQPGCLWDLYSTGCTINKTLFTYSGNVASSNPTAIAPIGGVIVPLGADDIPQYAYGTLLFTSGINNGLNVLIDSNDDVNLYLGYPLIDLPSPGDTITYSAGCSKTQNTCNLKFNNKQNRRGFDKVPPIMISV